MAMITTQVDLLCQKAQAKMQGKLTLSRGGGGIAERSRLSTRVARISSVCCCRVRLVCGAEWIPVWFSFWASHRQSGALTSNLIKANQSARRT
jgi:hypothetical protein